ncbi:hypothetical protein P692DRAFT_201742294 [Suillus brevipes Sb2]|nr:hypothetical protein P692DRAFT_201742294 [Suillus brevipes Sb2]
MPDGTRLLSGGSYHDPNIRVWDASNWQQVGDSWKDDTYMKCVRAISINPTGTLAVSLSQDNENIIRLWRISDSTTVAISKEQLIHCVAFSIDGRRILGGLSVKIILEFVIQKQPMEKALVKHASEDAFPKGILGNETPQIFAMTTAVRNAFISGDFPIAEQLLTQDIEADPKNYASYANRSFVMMRLLDWDRALHDATMSVNIQASFIGYISKGIALCGKMQVWDAMKVFDLAFTFAEGDSKMAHRLFLIKAIAMFNAKMDEESVFPVQELAARPNPDPVACRIVEAYMRVQLGNIAMDSDLHKEAADHFTAAVTAGASFATLDIHSTHMEFVLLFGWDLKSLWQIANQQRCRALLRTGQFGTAFEAYRFMMDKSDDPTKAIFLDWIPALDENE